MRIGRLQFPFGKTRRQRIVRAVGAVVLLLLIVVRLSVAPLLRRELIRTVQEHLNARLVIGDLSYSLPYGVVARDCHLILLDSATGEDVLQVQELSLRLARIPWPGSPLVVEDLTIRGPAVHIVRTAWGFAGESGIVRPSKTQSDTSNHKKFSDLLRLRHIGIENGEIIYEDRRRSAPPAVWSKINFQVNTSPRSPADYGFHIAANNAAAASLGADGAFNVDDLTASLDNLILRLQAGPEAIGQLPPEVQQAMERYQVRGDVILQASGHADANDLSRNSYSAKLTLQHASAYSPEANFPLDDLNFTIASGAGQKAASATVTGFSARSGDGLFTIADGATFSLDAATSRWSLQNVQGLLAPDLAGAVSSPNSPRWKMTGSAKFSASLQGPLSPSVDLDDIAGQVEIYLHHLSIQPPGFASPISDIDGPPIRLSRGLLHLHDLQAHYGRDELLLGSARLSLGQAAHGKIRFSDVLGTLAFRSPRAKYPGFLGDVFKKIQPGGEYVLSGYGSYDRDRLDTPLDYDMQLSCDRGVLAVIDPRFTIYQIKFDAEAFPDRLEVSDFHCHTLDGDLSLRGTLGMNAPYPFSGALFVDRVSLPKAVALAIKPKPGGVNLQGLIDVHTSISGSGPVGGKTTVDLLHAEGQFEIYGSDLWDVPALQKIESSARIARKALTIGEAAALFRVKDKVIELQNAAVDAPALGVQGYGTIGFDGYLDLHALAVPLGDWREKLQHTGIGFLDGVFADAVGQVQNTLNETTEHLLYYVHVYGPAADPQLVTEKTPALQNKAAENVTTMVQHSDADRPLTLVQPGDK